MLSSVPSAGFNSYNTFGQPCLGFLLTNAAGQGITEQGCTQPSSALTAHKVTIMAASVYQGPKLASHSFSRNEANVQGVTPISAHSCCTAAAPARGKWQCTLPVFTTLISDLRKQSLSYKCTAVCTLTRAGLSLYATREAAAL